MLSAGASNALLKTLEEPPAHVVFVLATTDPQKILPTLRSRAQGYEFRLLGAATLAEHLRWVVDDAGLEVDDDAIDNAVRRGQGSARDALSALDRIMAAGGVSDDDTVVDEMAEALCERDTARALVAVATACSAGRDPRDLTEALLAHLRDAFLSIVAAEVVSLPDAALELVADQGRRLGAPATVRALDVMGEALLAMREAPDARVVLEVALIRATRPEVDASPAALLERVERLERAGRGGAAPAEGGAGALPPAPVAATAGSARHAARQAVTAVTGTATGPGEATTTAPAGVAPSGASRPALGGLRREREAAPTPPAPAQPTTPAPPSPPAPAPPAAAVAGADIEHDDRQRPLPSRDELTVAWADHILGGLRPLAKGRFAAGRFAAVEGGTVTFAVPTDAMRGKCEVHRLDVQAALEAHFGRPIPLRLTVDTSTAAQMADGGAPGASLAEPVDLDDLRDAPPDDRSGLERLTEAFPGAEVVDDAAPGSS